LDVEKPPISRKKGNPMSPRLLLNFGGQSSFLADADILSVPCNGTRERVITYCNLDESMRIDCGCCVVRSWQSSDLDSLVRHANNFKIWINLRDQFPHPYTAENANQWLKHVQEARPETHFAIEFEGEAVGGIGFILGTDIARCSAEIGYWLGESVWGRGLATAALTAVTRHAIETHGLARLFATPFTANVASRRVLVKAGYALEGTLIQSAIKNGTLVDQALYAYVPGKPSFF